MVKRRGGHNEKEQNRIFFVAIIIGGQVTAARIEAADTRAAVTYTIGYLPITHALPVFEEKELLELENADV